MLHQNGKYIVYRTKFLVIGDCNLFFPTPTKIKLNIWFMKSLMHSLVVLLFSPECQFLFVCYFSLILIKCFVCLYSLTCCSGLTNSNYTELAQLYRKYKNQGLLLLSLMVVLQVLRSSILHTTLGANALPQPSCVCGAPCLLHGIGIQ